MSQEIVINATVREEVGKGASRRLRRQHGQIPAICYGGGKNPLMLTLEHNEILQIAEREAFYSSILDLQIEGRKTAEKVIVKDMQRHPYKPKILHVDFQRVKANEEIAKTVPLHFMNESKCVGVKAGGEVAHNITEVEITCLPKHLPEFIEVDMAEVVMDQTLHLSDLKLPEGVALVQLAHGHDLAVAGVHAPRVSKTEEGSEESSAE